MKRRYGSKPVHPDMARLYSALYSPPMTDAERAEHDQRVAEQRARDDAIGKPRKPGLLNGGRK